MSDGRKRVRTTIKVHREGDVRKYVCQVCGDSRTSTAMPDAIPKWVIDHGSRHETREVQQ